MGVATWSVIYLGTVADIDANEGTMTAEGASALLGSYGSTGAPLSDNVMEVTTTSSDGVMQRDNSGSLDELSFDLPPGGSPSTTQIDAIVVVNTTIHYADGTASGVGGLFVMQDTDGNLFLLADNFYAEFAPDVFDRAVDSMTINEIGDDSRSYLHQDDHDTAQWQGTIPGGAVCFLAGTMIQAHARWRRCARMT